MGGTFLPDGRYIGLPGELLDSARDNRPVAGIGEEEIRADLNGLFPFG